jgi:ABC-type branched-subunit amino acid transport system substrate-binding protein
MVRLGLCVLLLFAACAAGSTSQIPPGTPAGPAEPLPPPVAPEPGAPSPPPAPPAAPPATMGTPGAGAPADLGAEADFNAAKARFDGGDRDGARAALEGFVAHHPENASRPAAEIMLARLALLRGDAAGARKLLEPLAAAPAEAGFGGAARYYLGLAAVRLGQSARARELLLPFLPRPGATSPGDEALAELRGALAEATAGVGETAAALELWDGYYRGAREHEKAYARQRAAELAAQLSPEAAWRAYSASPEHGLARAALGPRAAAHLRAQGDGSGAAFIDGETAAARRGLGFGESGARVGPGDPTRVGLALPLSGKFQPVGEAAMRAAMLASGTPAAGQGAQLVVRDTGLDPERAARGVAELTREEAVIGIVGAAEKRAAGATFAQAAQDGIPLLVLDDAAPGALTTAFQIIHAPEARVAELARRALKAGAREFALLGPDSAGGKRLRDAFRREVTGAGARVTAEATYVAGATSFSGAVAALKKGPAPQAVFVADGADRLELIAPALAVADLWPAPGPAPWSRRPAAESGKPRPRNVLLLSTANDLSPRLLQNAGRYVQGALLSPGFYADAQDGRARAFVDAYRTAYGQDPHATEAYAYDGVNALRAVTQGGARTRADVLKTLSSASFEGLTGAMRFGPDHGRIDPPRVYVVDGDQIKLAP